jgi:hypothetical protein
MLYDLIKFEQKDPQGATAGGKRVPNLLALYLAAGGHLMIAGQHPVSMSVNPMVSIGVRYPIVFLYELEGDQVSPPDIEDPPGDESFAYRDLCIDVMGFAITGPSRWRGPTLSCPVSNERTTGPDNDRDHGMRAAIPFDPSFGRLELRPEVAAPGKFYHESERGLDVEVYNPQYFFNLCGRATTTPRQCFDPIYGLDCLDTVEPVYGQPVAFWTSRYADRVAGAPGSVAARSLVFGFPPVMFNPSEVKPAIEAILFGEWLLPQK